MTAEQYILTHNFRVQTGLNEYESTVTEYDAMKAVKMARNEVPDKQTR